MVKGFLIVLATAVVCGFAGGVLGNQIGQHAPSYYQTVFDVTPETNLVSLGTVLGFVQGLGAGLVVGLGIVLAVTWYEINKLRFAAERTSSTD